MINGLMLFGSVARGDVDENSDVDLLAVADIATPFSNKINGMEVQFIDSKRLLDLGASGDLFALHLANEGKVVFDLSGHLERLSVITKPKKSYLDERRRAIDLAWYLYEYGKTLNAELVNKRIAWCVRTVVISLLVERGKIIFSPHMLSKEFPDNGIPFLIGLRRSTSSSIDRFEPLRNFLLWMKLPRPDIRDEKGFLCHFDKTDNHVAITTYRKLKNLDRLGSLADQYL